ncbi:MAG TPA: hypothetical protein VF753_14965 [Terriglobales bacterium]
MAHSQTDVWKGVEVHPGAELERISVTKTQFDAIKRAISADGTGSWPCDPSGEDWTHALIFEDLPVSSSQKALLVQTGPGCARGGQGANGAMWVIRFDGDKPMLLATPKREFNGWVYSIQPSVSHGLRDLVLGWHMSAMETGLSYFQFDGTLYRRTGTATLSANANGNATIIPEQKGH